jgi:hypothetical protein
MMDEGDNNTSSCNRRNNTTMTTVDDDECDSTITEYDNNDDDDDEMQLQLDTKDLHNSILSQHNYIKSKKEENNSNRCCKTIINTRMSLYKIIYLKLFSTNSSSLSSLSSLCKRFIGATLDSSNKILSNNGLQ